MAWSTAAKTTNHPGWCAGHGRASVRISRPACKALATGDSTFRLTHATSVSRLPRRGGPRLVWDARVFVAEDHNGRPTPASGRPIARRRQPAPPKHETALRALAASQEVFPSTQCTHGRRGKVSRGPALRSARCGHGNASSNSVAVATCPQVGFVRDHNGATMRCPARMRPGVALGAGQRSGVGHRECGFHLSEKQNPSRVGQRLSHGGALRGVRKPSSSVT